MCFACYSVLSVTYDPLLADDTTPPEESMCPLNTMSGLDRRKTLALVLAGGSGTRLRDLTRERAKPAVPFGGHHRIVDYVLSNCVNSGISRIAVLTQYKARSLTRHLQENWLDTAGAGSDAVNIWACRQRNGSRLYAGTADAVYQNLDLIADIGPDNVLILAGDHVYEMDYADLIATHAKTGADVTISCIEVPASQCREFGIVEIDDQYRLKGFIEKPGRLDDELIRDGRALASMGVYLFSSDYLFRCLEVDAKDNDSAHDFGHSILPHLIGEARAYVSLFRAPCGKPGYWRDVGTIDSYWSAHQELLESHSLRGVGDRNWPLRGSPRVGTPARLTATSAVRRSALGAEAVVAGTVDRSLISAGCRVDEGARVTESVLLPGAWVGRNCKLKRVVVDSRCRIPDNTVLDARYPAVDGAFYVSPNGVTLVTEAALAAVSFKRAEVRADRIQAPQPDRFAPGLAIR